MDGRFAAYLGVSLLLIVTPGPDMALVTRNVLSMGWVAASFSAFGIGVGALGWAFASAVGVGIVLERSVILFSAIKIAGAVYLGYLGVRSLLGSRGHRDRVTSIPLQPVSSAENRIAFRQGLLGNLLNPKAGVIFVSILPQFIRPGDPLLRLLLMLLAFEVLLLAWLNLYSYLVSRVARSRFGSGVRQSLERVTGVVLLGLGAHLVFQRQ